MIKLRKELEQLTTEQLKRLTTSLQERLDSFNEELTSKERCAMVKKYNLASRIIKERTPH